MTLGQNITRLRKQQKLSQNSLGKKIGTSGDIIGRYERDEVKPSIEVASKIADILNVSLDYLVGKTTVKVDKSILKRVLDVQQMDTEDKEHILYTIDALIKNVKLKSIT
jgi:transcriptional regulator with XRE-family HTH domain